MCQLYINFRFFNLYENGQIDNYCELVGINFASYILVVNLKLNSSEKIFTLIEVPIPGPVPNASGMTELSCLSHRILWKSSISLGINLSLKYIINANILFL